MHIEAQSNFNILHQTEATAKFTFGVHIFHQRETLRKIPDNF